MKAIGEEKGLPGEVVLDPDVLNRLAGQQKQLWEMGDSDERAKMLSGQLEAFQIRNKNFRNFEEAMYTLALMSRASNNAIAMQRLGLSHDTEVVYGQRPGFVHRISPMFRVTVRFTDGAKPKVIPNINPIGLTVAKEQPK